MLRVDKINVHYGEIQAIDDVSLKISENEIVCILGSNGAGKTTLINTISGVLRTTSGKISFLGDDIESEPSHGIVEKGIIQIPEGRLLFPEMTVLENIEMGAYSHRARKEVNQNIEMVFHLFDQLKIRKKQLAGSLSGGEQQMLAIARGLMAKPKLLMLDEPSLGLAPVIVEEMFDIIKKINENGVTILLVEQNVFEAIGIADRGYVLENGSIVIDSSAKDLLKNKDVRKSYLGL